MHRDLPRLRDGGVSLLLATVRGTTLPHYVAGVGLPIGDVLVTTISQPCVAGAARQTTYEAADTNKYWVNREQHINIAII